MPSRSSLVTVELLPETHDIFSNGCHYHTPVTTAKGNTMQLQTRIRSTVAGLLSSTKFAALSRHIARGRRRMSGMAPTVYYFHQVDDPHSHLAVQKLNQLRQQYALPFITHLVSASADDFKGSAEHFQHWTQQDALAIAKGYGTTLDITNTPTPEQVYQANSRLSALLNTDTFAAEAYTTGTELWTSGNLNEIDAARTNDTEIALKNGNALQAKLGHYAGAMFYFDGEWYWGLNRLHLLEQRLIDEGFASANAAPCVTLPEARDTSGLNAKHISLEYFPSLRSPYTAIGHKRVLELIERSGVSVRLRPVMPMLMRGVPAPAAKQRYIITDAAREGRFYGVPLDRIVDPFGDPVKAAFNLYAGADALGQGMEFVTAYLSAAWQRGVDITTTAGLQQVAVEAGIDWQAMVDAAAKADWQTLLNDNLSALTSANLWGVPSFRISGGNNSEPFVCWGQDRIWRVEDEIAQRVK